MFSISAVSAEEINNETNVMENSISAVSAEEISYIYKCKITNFNITLIKTPMSYIKQ